MILRSWLIHLSLVAALGSSLGPRLARAESPYAVLGVGREATTAQIEKAFRKSMKGADPARQRSLATAFSLLTDPELRNQIDAGTKNLQLRIPFEQQARMDELLRPLDARAADTLKRTGKVTLDTVSSAAIFYLALAVNSAWKCFESQDSTGCRAYVDSLKSWDGYVGFGLFALASHLTSSGLTRVMGQGAAAQISAGFAGMAVGSLVNGVFAEVLALPEMKQLRELDLIKDPAEREKKRKELIGKIWSKTLGSAEWWKNKVPEITSMLVAAGAGQVTVSAITAGTRRGAETLRRSARTEKQGRAGRCLTGTVSALETFLTGIGRDGRPLRGGAALGQKYSLEFANLLLFLGYSDLLHPHANRTWTRLTVDRELDRLRNLPPRDRAQENQLKETAVMWNEHRHRAMAELEAILGPHSQVLGEFDQELAKTHDFYTWFMNGFKEDGSWEKLRDAYYSAQTHPEDIQKDIDRYLRAFFFGPDVQVAFQDSRDVHGLPVPGHLRPKVTPYRVGDASGLDPKKTSAATLKQRLLEGHYEDAASQAYAILQSNAHPARLKHLFFYENRVEKALLKTLDTEILPSYQTQISEIETLLSEQPEGSPNRAVVAKYLAQAKLGQESAARLRDYFGTPQDQREAPEDDLLSMLSQFDPENQEDWIRAVNYYKAFMLQ